MMGILQHFISPGLLIALVSLVITAIGVLITIFAWFLPRRARLRKEEEERMRRMEKDLEQTKRDAKEAKENIINVEKHLGIPIYVDGLPSADPPVFDPFFEGTKLMAEYKWDDAIAEFQKAMKEAKASQLVALFNLIAISYYTSGRLPLALEKYEESLRLARQFKDKQGEAAALGNIGLIYRAKGDPDQALKYHQEALEISKQIGHREYEASELGNIGLIYQEKGDLDQALRYLNEALKIFEEIGMQPQVEQTLSNIKIVEDEKKRSGK